MSLNPQAIKAGFRNAMINSSPLMAKITGVYHITAPAGTAYPYILYYGGNGFSELTFTEYVDTVRFTLDIWAKDTATKKAGTILDEIVPLVASALDCATLTVTGYSGVVCERAGLPLELAAEPEEAAEVRRAILQYLVRVTVTRGRVIT